MLSQILRAGNTFLLMDMEVSMVMDLPMAMALPMAMPLPCERPRLYRRRDWR